MSDNSYAAAGVNIEEGDRAVSLFAPHAKRATRPEVMGGLGGFAGLFKLGEYKEPILAAGSDGVGTKLAVAQAMDKHDSIGIDLVAMCVDDLVVCGAEPLFLQDYIAVGKVVPEKVAEIVKGIAEGCVQAGAALLGGETAEHPGMMGRANMMFLPPPSAWLRPMECWARKRCARAMCSLPWARPGCTPTATHSCATSCWNKRECH